MEGRSVLDWAKEYLEEGYSIIPIKEGDKKPLVKWQEYQSRKATLDEITRWFSEKPQCGNNNIGIVTGRISAITVLDVDPRHGGLDSAQRLGLQNPSAHTGGGGHHYYYSYCPALGANSAGNVAGLDIRSEGGYVLGPPSKTVAVYEWASGKLPRHFDLQPVPPEIVKALAKRNYESSGIKQVPRSQNTAGSIGKRGLQFEHVREGSRNNAAASTAGAIISYYQPTYDNGYAVLQLWNDIYVHPSLGLDELKATWDSIWNKHYSIGKYGINSKQA